MYAVPAEDLHLSVLELSHRHETAHLRGVYEHLTPELVRAMLALPLRGPPRLGRPMVFFDGAAAAVGFVPVGTQQAFTYHHLRAEMQRLALSSGLAIDTCYTAPSAHITVARFVGAAAIDGLAAAERFVAAIARVNRDLRALPWAETGWPVGGHAGLECQMGYLKFGRAAHWATAVGEPAL